MAGGRPTEYSEEILTKAQEYLDNTTVLPTIQGLALYIKVNQDTIYEWAKKHKEFSETLEDLKNNQAVALITRGLSGTYNPTIAKLLLSSNHNMREKSDVTTDGEAIKGPTVFIPKEVE